MVLSSSAQRKEVTMSPTRIAVGLAALVLGATACTSPGDDPSATPTTDLRSDQIQLTSALVTVDSCDALLDRLRTEGAERVGPYGFGGPIFGFDDVAVDVAEEEAGADGDSAGPATTRAPSSEALASDEATEGGGQDFTGTNNQEVGVDEADLVKTDGRRLVVASGERLQVIDVEGETPRLVDTIRLPEGFYGSEMFLSGDTVLLMSSGWTNVPFLREATDTSWFPGAPTGRIIEVDLAAGEIGTTLEFEGAYLSAREVAGTIRIVLSAGAERFNFVYPSNPGAEDTALKANQDLIATSTIDMWLPTYKITDANGVTTEGPIVECDRVHLPTEFAGFGSVVVLTADIDDGLRLGRSLSVFTDAQTVYASTDRLAVATPRWPELDEDGSPKEDDDYTTAIHTFDIADPGTTSYAASGRVRGHLLNQYSMSEHEGHLRVATTDGSPWDSRGSESFVTVLSEAGDELVQVGQVGGLGKGEQIFAVRFLGDRAYVVTFRQVDPLYTIDLSDPENPVTRGELKIPGFSQYLHPAGDHLIGIGTDGDEEGNTSGAVASLFDVSDPDDPRLVAKVPLAPGRPDGLDWYDSQSAVAWDARAFNIWDDTIIVPVSWWGYDEDDAAYQEFNGAAATLVRVDTAEGTLTPVGRVGHPSITQCEGRPVPLESDGVVVETDGFGQGDRIAPEVAPADDEPADEPSDDAEAGLVRPVEEEPVDEETADLIRVPDEEFCWTYQPEIRRTVVIGDDLFTISDAGVAVNRFDGLDTVAWIPFEQG
jgi:hypothetical protein